MGIGREEEKKILSVQDMLHLQSDKHSKTDKVMPDVDTSRYVLTQKPKAEAVRNFTSTANITEEQRRQFNQGGTAPNRNALLAEQARNAIKVAELHAKEEVIEQEKASAEKTAKLTKSTNELAKEIKDGNFEFGFGALIEGAESLKDTI